MQHEPSLNLLVVVGERVRDERELCRSDGPILTIPCPALCGSAHRGVGATPHTSRHEARNVIPAKRGPVQA
jgi:hypothetical protein